MLAREDKDHQLFKTVKAFMLYCWYCNFISVPLHGHCQSKVNRLSSCGTCVKTYLSDLLSKDKEDCLLQQYARH